MVRASSVLSPSFACPVLAGLALLGGFVVREQTGRVVVDLPSTRTAKAVASLRRSNESEDEARILAALEERIQQLERQLERLRNETTRSFGEDGENGSINDSSPRGHSSQHPRQQQLFPWELLPSCDVVMQQPHSPFKDGSFLTSHTTRIRWVPRSDGSRQLELLDICRLKRYNAHEANSCLAHKHVSMIGDSLTRYQHMSLAHLLEHQQFPPRFARTASEDDVCRHVNETGHPTCAPFNQPNMCVESDWKGWDNYYGQLCGSSDGGLMNGRMECHSYRIKGSRKLEWNDNMLYVNRNSRATLSFSFETGMGPNKEANLFGFYYTNCTSDGNCRRTDADTRRIKERTLRGDFDWNQSFPDAIASNGTLRTVLPPVDYVIYNRGIWGLLSEDRAQRIMPLLREWVSSSSASSAAVPGTKTNGRCFFKSTTGHSKSLRVDQWEHEARHVRPHALYHGCSYLDYAHLTQIFAALDYDGAQRDPDAERRSVFVDPVHYHPWVYEELNQVLLNVLCNDQKYLPDDSTAVPTR